MPGIRIIPIGLCLLCCVPPGDGSVVCSANECSQSRWPQTVYYRFSFNAAVAGDAVVRLTAVDAFEAFFGGESLGTGTDGDWTTAEEFPVTLRRRGNHLAVQVDNSGRGQGSGLLVEITGPDGQAWASNTSSVSEPWLWTGEPQEDGGWRTSARLDEEVWRPVQRGRLDRGRLAGWSDDLGAEVIAGFPGGVDAGRPQGGLTLRTTFGENLAHEKPGIPDEVFDGDFATRWQVNPDALSASARVDLLQPRLIGEVRVITFGGDPDELAGNRLLGYGVQVSNDRLRWKEVGVRHGVEEYHRSGIAFDPVLARFLQVVVAEVDPVNSARVAEIQVLGAGTAPEGSFVSAPLDLGSPGRRKNFESVRRVGYRPGGTDLLLRFRSSDDAVTWSPWSAPIEAEEAALQVPEPRVWLQYRVDLKTRFEDAVPRLDSLAIRFTDRIPVSSARASVSPNEAVLGRETRFSYLLVLDFAEDDPGVERVRIATPSRAVVERVEAPAGVGVEQAVAWGDRLELRFASVWRQSDTLRVDFRARLLTESFSMWSRVYGPEKVSLETEEDTGEPDPGTSRSWLVRASAIEGDLLGGVRAEPDVFSPNGDGINEGTAIEFFLARVGDPQWVEVGVFDLGGRMVRMVRAGPLGGGEYARPLGGGDAAALPGYWDGRDGSGALVPPGIYLARVRVRSGREVETRAAPVAVVY